MEDACLKQQEQLLMGSRKQDMTISLAIWVELYIVRPRPGMPPPSSSSEQTSLECNKIYVRIFSQAFLVIYFMFIVNLI